MIVSHQKHISAEALKKRYCHICGEKLDKNPTTKTVSPKDKEEWSQYERVGRSHVLPVGDIKVTEFLTFICPKCGNEISIYKQAVVALIQKKLNKKGLTEEELSSNLSWANKKYEKNQKTKKIIFFVFFALIAISLLCLIMLFGNLSFELTI